MTYKNFEEWLTRNHIRTTLVMFVAVGMLFWVTVWSMNFASLSLNLGAEGMGSAAIVAAVQGSALFFAKWACEQFERLMK